MKKKTLLPLPIVIRRLNERTNQKQLHSGGRASRGKSAGGNPLSEHLLMPMHKRNCLILKMKVKVMECNIRNCPILWQIPTFKNIIPDHCSLTLTVFDIFTFQTSWPWKCRSRWWCTTFVIAPFDGKYLTSCLMAIVMCVFSQLLLVKKPLEVWH